MTRSGGRWRWSVPVLVAGLIAAVLVGCEKSDGPGSIAWHPCGAEDGVNASMVPTWQPERLRCGRLSVPLDPANPAAGTVSLAIARLAASVRSTETLVVDPGGPGASAVEHVVGAATRLMAQPIATATDIVGVDWRGVGASRPSVRCRTDRERDAERAVDFGDRTPAGIARIEMRHRTLAAQCRDRVGAALLARVGTEHDADDLDRVRIALGKNMISILGYSYGSRLGITYARRHPLHVRALVLDGVVDPDADPIEATVAQSAGFDHALDAFMADCAGHAACPFSNRVDAAVARYRTLVNQLVTRPLPIGARALGAADAVTGTLAALYGQDRWPRLRAALSQLARGRGGPLLALADDMEGRATDGHYTTLMDSFLAVGCADDPRIADRRRYDELDTRVRQVAPFRDDGRGTGRGPVGICEFWTPSVPAQPPTNRAQPMPPTLIVSTLGDPATPHPTAVALARRYGVGLLTVRGVGHTVVFGGNDCVDDAVDTFLARPTPAVKRLTC